MRKFLAMVLGLMMVVSMLSVASAEANPVTVSVWCAYAGEDPYGKYVYEYADKFMAANPGIKVEVTAVSSNDIYAKLAAMATTPDIPTLFYTSADQAPSLVDIGLVADMSKYLTADELAAFGNGVVDGCQVTTASWPTTRSTCSRWRCSTASTALRKPDSRSPRRGTSSWPPPRR